MNARIYVALVLFGCFVVVQPNVDQKEKLTEKNRKGILVDDMMFTPEQYENRFGNSEGISQRSIGVRETIKKWPNGLIPYALDTNDTTKKMMLRRAMEEWQNYTCLNFIETIPNEDQNMIHILIDDVGCWSEVGRFSYPEIQYMSLVDLCWHHEVILHELGHAIGLEHEHTRADRNDYVTIHSENIYGGKHNFEISDTDDYGNLNTKYDYFSIMHYPDYAFAVNKKATITTKDPAMQKRIGYSKHLSFGDIKGVNIMYNCKDSSGQCDLEDSDCPDDGFVDKTCSCMCPSPNGLDQFPVPCLPTSNGTMNGNASLISP